MKNNMFAGFGTVFTYNFKNHVSSKKYIGVTIACALVLIIGIIVFMAAILKPKEEVIETIDKVYVTNETELGIPSYSAFAKMAEDDVTAAIEFEKLDVTAKEFIEASETGEYIVVNQTKTEDGYVLQVIPGPDCHINSNTLNNLGQMMSTYFRGYVLQMTGLSEEALYQVLLPIGFDVTNINEEEVNEGKELFVVVSTFVMILVIYILVCVYGQQVCTDVSLEKTSKLTEQLLVSVSPYSLVAGKILASIASSILQFIIWIASIFVGVFAGNEISIRLYSLESSGLSIVFGMIKEWIEGSNFGPAGIVIGILIVFAGIILFLVIAGMAGSTVTKPEEASTVQGVYMIPIMISYFLAIFAIVKYMGNTPIVYHMIPFVSAFVTPGAMMAGALPIWVGITSLAISLLLSAILLVAAAKIYKALIFYNGNKLKMKDFFRIVFK